LVRVQEAVDASGYVCESSYSAPPGKSGDFAQYTHVLRSMGFKNQSNLVCFSISQALVQVVLNSYAFFTNTLPDYHLMVIKYHNKRWIPTRYGMVSNRPITPALANAIPAPKPAPGCNRSLLARKNQRINTEPYSPSAR
jgi:hypothetical protein